jgi:ABC-type dipeptide/oligopeptide/nickel transport system permease component
MGAALLIATFYVLLNLAIDLAHAYLDPRVAQEAL